MFFFVFIFLFGLAIGSFLNVLIFRLGSESGQGIYGRSKCPNCGHILAWQDLVPVLSFIWLGGKCRYCGKKISWQYPIVEIATGLLFLLIFNYQFSIINQFPNFQLSNFTNFIYLFFITSCLIVIFVSDLRFFIIPDKIICWAAGGTFIYKFFEIWNFRIENLLKIGNWKLEIFQPLGFYLLAALGASVFFLAVIVATKGRGMGFGDAKLAFLMGFLLGWPKILLALLFAFVSGAIFGLALIAFGKAKMKSQLPFGTFLSASAFLIMLWGEKILSRYFDAFL